MNEVHDFDGCRLHSSTRTDHIRVSAHGELDASNSSGVRSVLVGMLGRTTCLVVDLQRTRFIDSSGLGALIHVAKAAERAKVEFEVVRPSPEVRRMIALTGLEHLLHTDRSDRSDGGPAPSSDSAR